MTLVPEGAPGRQHFDLWRATLDQYAMPVAVSSPYEAEFTGSMQVSSFDTITTLLTDNSTISVDRTAAHIRQSDPEVLLLLLNLGNSLQRIAQSREEAVLGQGDMTLIHSSRPHRCESQPDVPRQQGMIVSFDGDALGLAPVDMARLVGQRLDGTDGVGRLVSGFLSTLATVGDALDPVDALRLSSVTADLLSVMLGRRLGMLSTLDPERRDRERLIHIRHFIRTNLGNPDLTPELIAGAHHISLRTLHRLFQTHAGTTVSAWIRERRLEAYRADLLDPRLSTWSVHRIAATWGFTDASRLSRAFKAAYGLSPAAYRAVHTARPER